jgi:CRISPR/Cas system CSM-associated protein Csm3 (group 7 of RAMP superfamily)
MIAEARALKKPIYLAAIDCRDTFGSVSHEFLKKNLEYLGVNEHLNNFIIDSYNGATVSIFTKNRVTNEIQIKKGVKQGCPLSPILFNICIDPILKFIRDANPQSGFNSEFLDERAIQGYADDIVLIEIHRKTYKNKLIVQRNFLNLRTSNSIPKNAKFIEPTVKTKPTIL